MRLRFETLIDALLPILATLAALAVGALMLLVLKLTLLRHTPLCGMGHLAVRMLLPKPW
ncbi:MAG: hypothetical protein IPJ47_03295 [Anaerolineales bacterium]|nr:hypothetical protein [Anaerolineales bacterium]